MKSFFLILFLNVFIVFNIYSQKQSDSLLTFEKKLFLQSFDNYGVLFGEISKYIKLPAVTKKSFLKDSLWGHILPKFGQGNIIVLTKKEIQHFAELSNIKLKFSYENFRIPNWKKFHKINRFVSFTPKLSLLILFENDAKIIDIDILTAKKYFTFYPYGTYGKTTDYDKNSIPIVYLYKTNSLKPPLVTALISSKFKSKLKLDDIIVEKKITYINNGENDKLITITVDLNNDGQPDIVKLTQILSNNRGYQNRKRHNIESCFIAILHNGKWYRTSFAEIGQDGLGGF